MCPLYCRVYQLRCSGCFEPFDITRRRFSGRCTPELNLSRVRQDWSWALTPSSGHFPGFTWSESITSTSPTPLFCRCYFVAPGLFRDGFPLVFPQGWRVKVMASASGWDGLISGPLLVTPAPFLGGFCVSLHACILGLFHSSRCWNSSSVIQAIEAVWSLSPWSRGHYPSCTGVSFPWSVSFDACRSDPSLPLHLYTSLTGVCVLHLLRCLPPLAPLGGFGFLWLSRI